MRVNRLTEKVTVAILAKRRGTDAAADRVAARIVADVRKRGDAALFAWTAKLDRGPRVDARNVWVTAREMRDAARRAPREFLEAVDHAARNIRRVAKLQRPRAWRAEIEPGVQVSQRVTAIDSVGCYVPGGRFSLVSSLLMTAIPAQEAGVRRIVAVSPQPGDALLAVAARLGIDGVARVGGAQAIAALAYGTSAIARVDKICGPGNRYVTAAKRLVSADCAIDLVAGPTEAILFAENGNAEFMAADLTAQAEHDPDAISVFVTTSRRLADEVAVAMARQLAALPPANLARVSLARNGAILLARNVAEAARFVARFAPEHLTLAGDAARLVDQFPAAGTIFLGDWSAEVCGDYATGTNHVLPTGGMARTRAGLSTADFVKCGSMQRVTRAGFQRLAPVARAFATAEGLVAHRRSIEVRE
jgi:histidinol dehydrogenase